MPKLLVVDDHAPSHNLFKSVFAQLGHEVDIAYSGREALEAIASARPDAVILDALLPDGSGLEFYRKIIEIDANLPVIVMGASSDSREAIEAVKLGALDYLVEPLNFPELAKTVETAFEIRRLAIWP